MAIIDRTVPPALQRAAVLRAPRSLTQVFIWLLGGDFAFSFFEQIFTRFVPLFAKDLHASNTLIGIMTGSLAGAVNVFFLPNISMLSDRHRGPLGRRIPFLLWSVPATVASLILVAFAPEVGRALYRARGGWLPVSEPTVVLAALCAFTVSWHLWNMVLVNAFNWLVRDVVPMNVIGRFLSWFRITGTLGTFVFLWWVFPHVLERRKEIFVTVGIIYTVIFMLMCWRVREGEYPTPAPLPPGENMLARFGRYFRQCLSVKLYRYYFIVYILMIAATSSANPFLTLLARDRLGLSMQDMGHIFAWGTLALVIA
jgi:maltose/moltooligosaccharide transporter